jgi:hypothetical protein
LTRIKNRAENSSDKKIHFDLLEVNNSNSQKLSLGSDGEGGLSLSKETSVGTLTVDPRAISLAQENLCLPRTSSTKLAGINVKGEREAADGVGLHQKVVGLTVGLIASRPDLQAEHTGTSGAENLVDQIEVELGAILD